jgi:hypothetical protein
VGAVAGRRPAAGAPVTSTLPMPAVLHGEPISYRQMQHWITRFPDRFSASAKPGRSGVRRELTVHDVAVLLRMARLVEAGFRPDAAARLTDNDGRYFRLTPHVVVGVSVGAR